MQYAVYHSQRGKGSGGGLGNHIDRVQGKEHTYKNADSSRTHLNQEFIKKWQGKSLSESINLRIKEGYKGNKAIRKDAVKYVSNILTGSHLRMIEIFKDKALAQEWLKENYRFACDEFGKDNIVRFTLHLDEKTPHVHCVTVPLTSDGRLSAKEVIGNRTTLKKRQDKYAEMMNAFGLKRGVSAELTGRRHETAQEYQSRLVKNNTLTLDIKPVKTLGMVRVGKTIEKTEKELKKAQNAISTLSAELQEKTKLLQNAERNYNETKEVTGELYTGLKYSDVTENVKRKYKIKTYRNPTHEENERKERDKKFLEQKRQEQEERKAERKNQNRGRKL